MLCQGKKINSTSEGCEAQNGSSNSGIFVLMCAGQIQDLMLALQGSNHSAAAPAL